MRTFDDFGFSVQNILRLALDLQKSRSLSGSAAYFMIAKARIQDMCSDLLRAIVLCSFVAIDIQQISFVEYFNHIFIS